MSHHHSHPHSDHPHDHDHSHDHGHSHDSAHSHSHDAGPALDFEAKLARILAHWRRHNDDHLDGYRQWAEDAASHGHASVAGHLEAVLELSRQISERLEQARQALAGE